MKIKRVFGLQLTTTLLLSCAVGCGGEQGTSAPSANGSDAASTDSGNAAPEPAPALDYPTRSINFVVPYGAGGGTDVMGRAVVGTLDLGVSTYVTDIEGASAGTGSMEVYHSDADGYTLLVHQAEALVTYVTAGTYSEALDTELTPIATVTWDPMPSLSPPTASSPLWRMSSLMPKSIPARSNGLPWAPRATTT